MMTLPRPQDLNVAILRLVHERKAVAEPQIHALLAFEISFHEGTLQVCDASDVWRFSAIVNIARKRLVRYGFLRIEADNRLAITPRGEAFLDGGLTKVNARSRHAVDSAMLDSLECAFKRTA
jgi:hypothetical protein